MKRKIIKINEDLCNGCSNCVTGCSEGALQIVNGKARLLKEDFCDGFGDCIGTCPTGALTIEERDVKPFDESAVKENLLKTQGKEAVKKMEEAQKKHTETEKKLPCGCPGTMSKSIGPSDPSQPISSASHITAIPSELRQWPVQLHLVSPNAPYFNNRELVILSTCSPISSADIHWRFIRGRSVVVACPKLDNTTPYVDKLVSITTSNHIPKIICVIMEVPCCRGLVEILKQAITKSGKNVNAEICILNLDGSIKEIKNLNSNGD